MTFSVEQIFQELKLLNETSRIEAKRGSGIGDSVLQTVCAFANEPVPKVFGHPHLLSNTGDFLRNTGDLGLNAGHFQKRKVAISEKLSSHLANIVVTLSAFRSIATPWRLFLCLKIWGSWKIFSLVLRTILLTSTKWSNRLRSAVSGFGNWKPGLDLFVKYFDIRCNIAVTLSAFRSNAEPWRLFLCTPFKGEWEMGS